MSVQVATCSAQQLLSKTPIFQKKEKIIKRNLRIPEYQRPYVWDEKQIKNLIVGLKEHFHSEQKDPYYLGSLILHKDKEIFNIIDGQQRITTLILLSHLLNPEEQLEEHLKYDNPISQKNINKNAQWIKSWIKSFSDEEKKEWKELLDLEMIHFSIVITDHEDEAYLFFETQNSGGIPLNGSDVIKAHHLRAIEEGYRITYAQKWEGLGELTSILSLLWKGRYSNYLKYENPNAWTFFNESRDNIVEEFASKTKNKKENTSYRKINFTHIPSQDDFMFRSLKGYELRQPLNVGINTVEYLSYFQNLYEKYWKNSSSAFVKWIKELNSLTGTYSGYQYPQPLYEACLILYISQFGEEQIKKAEKKIFRVVYSPRMECKVLRKESVFSLVEKKHILDWIAFSYTPEECLSCFDSFDLKMGTPEEESGIRINFLNAINEKFHLDLPTDEYKDFAKKLDEKIKEKEF